MGLKRTRARTTLAQLAVDTAPSAFVAVGAVLAGAIAVGRLIGRRSSLRTVRADYLSTDALTDYRPRAREFVRDDISPPPIR